MIKEKIKSKGFFYPFLLLRTLINRTAIAEGLHHRRKPNTLQMPITSRCNSRCVTCNVWKHKDNSDIDPKKLKEVLADPFFSEVEYIGVNGGELTLVPNFEDVLDSIFTVKKLKGLHFISNGLLPNKLLPLLEKTKKKCDERGVRLNFCLSVDGFGKIHELVRGVPNCFTRTKQILDTLRDNPSKFAHNVTVGCTLSQKNIAYVIETEEFLSKYPFYVQYHIAVPNKRIHTFNDSEAYYVMNDKRSKMLATEYFYKKFMEAKNGDKFAYFAQYYFLLHNGKKRLTRCPYKYRDVTIDENLNMYLCATASDKIGDLKSETVANVISPDRIKEIERNTFVHCDECVHYIYNQPTLYGLFLFHKEIIKRRFDWGSKFELLTR